MFLALARTDKLLDSKCRRGAITKKNLMKSVIAILKFTVTLTHLAERL